MEAIQVKFDGGIATDRKLHFYEYSRSQYGLARFVATVEHFRRTGAVAERVNQRSYVDILVQAPTQGSFIETILIPGVQDAMAAAISTQFTVLFSYVWQLLMPRQADTDDTISELARIRLAEERERSSQSREETQRIRQIARIVETQNATVQQSLDLVSWALSSNNTRIGRLQSDGTNLQAIAQDLQSEQVREQTIQRDGRHLRDIDPNKISRLTSRVRPMVAEIALPLRRSASSVSLGTPENDAAFATLDQERAKQIDERSIREEPIEFTGHLKSYDRDAGVGKIVTDAFARQMTFFVPPSVRKRMRNSILAAMRVETALFNANEIVDGSGITTSLILNEVSLAEQ